MAGNKNSGRKKGSKDKLPQTVKETYVRAFHELQKKAENKTTLVNWARANPTEFYKLATKLIPTEVEGKLDVAVRAIKVTIDDK